MFYSLCLAAISTFALLQLSHASILPTTDWTTNNTLTVLHDDANDTVLVSVGGSNGDSVVADVAVFDLTTNAQKNNGTPAPTPLELFGSAIFEDTIYIINGMNSSQDAQNEFWAYNVAKDMWISNLPDVPTATIGSQAVEVGGQIYLLGGFTDMKNPTYNEQVYIYSTRLRKWYTQNTTIPQTDDNPCAVVQEMHLYYLPAGSLYHSDDGANTWETLAAPSANRTGGSCVAIGMDAILLTGGQEESVFLNSAEIYNITSNEWTPAAPMKTSRSGAWAVLIPSGGDNTSTVLVCGGGTSDDDGNVVVQQSCETYDVQKNEWSDAGFQLDQPRADFGLFVLPPVQPV